MFIGAVFLCWLFQKYFLKEMNLKKKFLLNKNIIQNKQYSQNIHGN